MRALFVLLLLTLGLAPAAAQERAQLVDRLKRLEAETRATEARAAQLGETLVDLAGDEAKLRQKLTEVTGRITVLEARIADDAVAINGITADQAAIRQDLAAKREGLATVLMALQRIARRPPPALFADGGDPTDVVRGAILLNAALPALDAEAKALAATLAEASRLSRDEELRWTRLREDLAAVEAERTRLTALMGEMERRRALSLFERDRASADLARLAEEADTVEALLDRLSRGDARQQAAIGFSARKGGLAAPVAGRVVGRFGDPDAVGGLTAGRSIAALAGATVIAPMPATVVYAAPFRSYGHVLILDAGEGYHMVLTGLATVFVEAGDDVKAGSPLGRMGDRRSVAVSGVVDDPLLASRPLLYVELRRDGSAIDSHGWWRDPSLEGGRTTE
ncbi:MAG: peptidoglycan DD-metalloendopeptidase family protein [Pseudomonadota bacterium]